jgi:DNA-binding CsgD family transcriptional regulator
MTPKMDPARRQNVWTVVHDGGSRTGDAGIAPASYERTRTANEVGSAIVHQLNGPLTALRLYVGEIKQRSGRFLGTTVADETLQRFVENAFQETERVCAMVRLIADTFEQELHEETAVELGRDVISWWTRGSGLKGAADGPVEAGSIDGLLTPRERQVLRRISDGCSNKEGAARMKIGVRTFESHRARIMRKLGARNGADLVRMVLGENTVAS